MNISEFVTGREFWAKGKGYSYRIRIRGFILTKAGSADTKIGEKGIISRRPNLQHLLETCGPTMTESLAEIAWRGQQVQMFIDVLQNSTGRAGSFDPDGYKEFTLKPDGWYCRSSLIRFYEDPLMADVDGNPLN